MRQTAGHSSNRGPQVSFDRPELSPCLASWPDKTHPSFQEALALIQAGAAALARNPEADAPGFQPNAVDQWRDAKYVARQQRVSEAWRDAEGWTQKSILNAARSGKFSSDRAIAEYCDEIWGVAPVRVGHD